jgi:type I restriction enzyme R subunit
LTPEDKARQQIDKMLVQAGWHVCDFKDANIHAARGVVIRNYPLSKGHGFADYLFYIDGKAAGVIEGKRSAQPNRRRDSIRQIQAWL